MYGYLEAKNLPLVLELRGISTKMFLTYMIWVVVFFCVSWVIWTVPREFSLLFQQQIVVATKIIVMQGIGVILFRFSKSCVRYALSWELLGAESGSRFNVGKKLPCQNLLTHSHQNAKLSTKRGGKCLLRLLDQP